MVEFQMLGPLEVRAGGTPVDLGTAKQRIVLAALLVDLGGPVPVDTLVDRVWDEEPPAGARNVLYAHVSRIRRMLSQLGTRDQPLSVERGPTGYTLRADPGCVDLHRFRALMDRARQAEPAGDGRCGLLADAVRMWRGEPLAGLPGRWVQRLREGLRRQRLDAAVHWSRAELAEGHPGELVDELRALVAENPIVEPLTAALMRALHAAGRSAEALDCYQQTRQRLIEDLGTDPGPELREVYEAILRGSLAPRPARASRPASSRRPAAAAQVGPPVPAQLPLDGARFTGRRQYLDRLDALLPRPDGTGNALPIAAIVGTAGVGKSALALHWAHRVAARFPDGQLYLNLRGFDPNGAVMTPQEAIRALLDALSVPPDRMPYGLDAQTALYRSRLADRRVLVVLDNARDVEQVRPLLPGAAGCLVVVTSRNQLAGLVAAAGAYPLSLDVPDTAETLDLLSARIGRDRVASDPLAAQEIVESCVRLPLAVAIAAARAATHPRFPLAQLAAELRDATLDAFVGQDPSTDLRAVFSWSLAPLGPDARRLFRLLGLAPGPDIGVPAAASLAGVPVSRVRVLLGQLTRAHLLLEVRPGRYAFHDLLRAYAIEQGAERDPEQCRADATHRLLDHYLHTAHTAALRLNPQRGPLTLVGPRPGVQPAHLPDRAAALAWFSAEYPVLLAAIRLAEATCADAHTWQLCWTLTTFFDRRGNWQDWLETQRVGLIAARRVGDPIGLAHAHRGLGLACARQGQEELAQSHYRQALALYRQLGDPVGQANLHNNLSWLDGSNGRHRSALRHARQALVLYRAAGHQVGEAGALNAIGWYHGQLGDHQATLTHCTEALGVLRGLGDRRGEAATWDSLGHAHHNLADHSAARTCYQRALALFDEVGDRHNEAVTLVRLGDTELAAGSPATTRAIWQRAIDIFTELGHLDAEQVRIRLAALGGDEAGLSELRELAAVPRG